MSDAIDDLVDWQLSNPPKDATWTCPDCGMNWTEQPTICPCDPPEQMTAGMTTRPVIRDRSER